MMTWSKKCATRWILLHLDWTTDGSGSGGSALGSSCGRWSGRLRCKAMRLLLTVSNRNRQGRCRACFNRNRNPGLDLDLLLVPVPHTQVCSRTGAAALCQRQLRCQTQAPAFACMRYRNRNRNRDRQIRGSPRCGRMPVLGSLPWRSWAVHLHLHLDPSSCPRPWVATGGTTRSVATPGRRRPHLHVTAGCSAEGQE